MTSLYQQHVKDWHDCQRCDLHKTRKRVVLARGQLPCDALFAGEAPALSENILGKPFCGPAGNLLDKIVAEAMANSNWQPRIAFTNLVGCIPASKLDGSGIPEPPEDSIKACAPRLKELVRMAQPRLIVLVGKLAKKHVIGQADFCNKDEDGQPPWMPQGQFLHFEAITHPAAILRMDTTQKGLAIQRCVITLAEAFEELHKEYRYVH